MDRTVLLVLCLQVFLLISTFTTSDAAAQWTDADQSPYPAERGYKHNERRFGNRRRFQGQCRRDGSCVNSGTETLDAPPPPPPPPPPRSPEQMEERVQGRRRNNRLSSYCSKRPGGCSLLGSRGQGIPAPVFTPPPPPPPPPPRSPEQKEGRVQGRRRNYRPSNCSWRPGACRPGAVLPWPMFTPPPPVEEDFMPQPMW